MSRRRKQTIISGIVAGIGIALIVGAAWYMSKEYRFTTYKNAKNGFSIKYPAAWAMEENVNGAAVIFYSSLENDLDFFRESVNVVVQDISANPMDLQKYSELAIKQMEAVFGENFIMIDSKPFLLAGKNGYQIVFIGKSPEFDLRYKSTWVLDGLTAYQVTYTAINSQYERYLPKVDKIIRSFRILSKSRQ